VACCRRLAAEPKTKPHEESLNVYHDFTSDSAARRKLCKVGQILLIPGRCARCFSKRSESRVTFDAKNHGMSAKYIFQFSTMKHGVAAHEDMLVSENHH
jgi:hypothetical protein